MLARDTIPVRTLLEIARRRLDVDPSRCRLVIDLLGTANALRHLLQQKLQGLGVSESDIYVLLTLLAISPDPSTPAALATQARVTRPAATDAIDRLEKRGFVRRVRNAEDRRQVSVFVTEAGIKQTELAIAELLHVSDAVAADVNTQAATDCLATFQCLCDRVQAELTPHRITRRAARSA